MLGKFEVAYLIGTTEGNEGLFRYVEEEMTKFGFICFAPVIYDLDIYELNKELFDEMCYQKLTRCDICVVVTPDRVDKLTEKRISQALKLSKLIVTWDRNTDRFKTFDTFEFCKNNHKPKFTLDQITKIYKSTIKNQYLVLNGVLNIEAGLYNFDISKTNITHVLTGLGDYIRDEQIKGIADYMTQGNIHEMDIEEIKQFCNKITNLEDENIDKDNIQDIMLNLVRKSIRIAFISQLNDYYEL